MKAIITIILLASVSLLSAQQTVFDAKITSNKIVATVTVEKGNTLYSIARALGTSVPDILSQNRKSDPQIKVGERLNIVLDPSLINTQYASVSNPRAINIKTTPGDNLYRISKVTGLSQHQILTINGRTSESLDVGETLLLGWIQWPTPHPGVVTATPSPVQTPPAKSAPVQTTPVQTVPSIAQTKDEVAPKNDISPIKNTKPQPRTSISVPQMPAYISSLIVNNEKINPTRVAPQEGVEKEDEIKTVKGIAYWEKSRYAQTDLIAMHPSAKVNSKISIYNPMLKRKVEATVVGEMPEDSYADDVSVVISPSVADALGALDRRFLVEITYVE